MSVITREGNTATITLGSDFTPDQIPAVRQEILAVLADSPSEVRLDLTRLNALDPVGLGLLLATRNSVQAMGAQLVVQASENVTQLLRSVHLDAQLQSTHSAAHGVS